MLLFFFCAVAVATKMSSGSTVPARNRREGKECKNNSMYRQQRQRKTGGEEEGDEGG